jgi:hypothetical protein
MATGFTHHVLSLEELVGLLEQQTAGLVMKHLSSFSAHLFGVASLAFTLAFWIYVNLGFPRHSYHLDVASVVILSCGIPASLIAAWRGSKLWLIALLGPLSGWILILTFIND